LVGDREREEASLTLRRHYREGRLTVDELDERLEVVLAARYRHQIRGALRGLPLRWADPEAVVRDALRPAARAARDAAFLLATGLLWVLGSLLLLVAFAGWLLSHGPSLAGLLVFPLVWLSLTWVLWWGAHRRRTRRR
jgi:hypothetical protein